MDSTNLEKYFDFYNGIIKKINNYEKEVRNIGFASPEKLSLKKNWDNISDALKFIEAIMNSNIELNKIFEACPNSIYVVDKNGATLRANKGFERTTGVMRKDVVGKSVYDIEKLGYFNPSINGLALHEKREVSIVQMASNGKETIVTAVPFFNKHGEICGSVSNAKLLDEINGIINYFKDSKSEADNKHLSSVKMICKSFAMQEIIAMVDDIINTDSNIITGETGVGKGVLTRYIHENSNRRDHRLIEINCGAIPESLLESELFGYESGAFTGANKKGKLGLIELADKGTIFFDEINALPLLLQVKLLHFLQDKTLTRVGGTKQINVDVRIVAASNSDLIHLMDIGEFRADLFYRLNVVPINIPPLRERREDLLDATEYFLEKYNEKYGKQKEIKKSQWKKMFGYDWPGNLRELENYIERMVVTSGKAKDILKTSKLRDEKYIESQENIQNIDFSEATKLQDLLDDFEKSIITQSYERNKSSYRVAEELGISQASAHRKIKKYT